MKNKYLDRLNLPVWFVMVGVVLLTACAQTPVQEEEVLVFPPPPDEPRFYFEHVLVSSFQVQVDDSQSRLRRLVTGEQKSGQGFAKPFDVQVCKGSVYVSDTVQRGVLVFDFPGAEFRMLGRDEGAELSKPLGMATDGECNLYVADITGKRVVVFSPQGRFLRAIGGSDYFKRVGGVAVNPEGTRIYAVDTGGVQSQEHQVRVFDAQSGEHLFDFGTRGPGDGQFNLPKDIDMGPDRNLYIVDSGNFRIAVFDENGEFVRNFGTIGRRMGQFSRPKGVALDPDGRVYVSDASHGNVQIFTPEGQLLLFIGTRSESPGRAKYLLPAGVDVDEDGRIYFVAQFYRRVDIFRPAALATTEGYLGVWPKP